MPVLLINADDFYMDPQVNQGIVAASQNWVLIASSFCTNLPVVEHAANLIAQFPALDSGTHLNVSRGMTRCTRDIVSLNFRQRAEWIDRCRK